MFRLALMLFAMIATTLSGIGVIVVLSLGYDTWIPIIAAAGVGFVVAIPASILIARKIQDNVI